MSLTTVQLRVATVGEDGAAVGEARRGVPPGRLVGVQVNYHGSAPGTTDVTLKNVLDGVESTLLTKAGSAADIPLRAFADKPIGGTGAEANTYVPPLVHGTLLLEVTACDALADAVVATLVIEV